MSASTDPIVQAVEIEQLCEVMHDAYEDAAVREGWATQQASRKPWSEVPEPNKATMRVAVQAVIAAVTPLIREQVSGDLTMAGWHQAARIARGVDR